jgi:hypothetical protein
MAERMKHISEYFEFLERVGISADELAVPIHDMSGMDVLEFVSDCNRFAPHDTHSSSSFFDFVANSSLSGGDFPCQMVPCRIERADHLARYAALYANRVVIPDPFEKYGLTLQNLGKRRLRKEALESLRTEIIGDLAILYHLRPLLESGHIVLASAPWHFCAACYERVTGRPQEELPAKLKKVFDAYLSLLAGRTRVKWKKGKWYSVAVEGYPTLAPHDLNTLIQVKNARKLRESVADASGHNPIKLEDAVAHAAARHLAQELTDDSAVQDLYGSGLGLNYLTDREVDLTAAGEARSAGRDAAALAKGLGHALPFVEQVPLERLLRLRNVEGDAFEVYRAALKKIVSELRDRPAGEISEAVSDIINPELAKIDMVFKKSKKLLKDSLVRDTIYATGFVTVGLTAGILPTNVGQIVAGVGGLTKVGSMLTSASKLLQEPEEVRGERFYFLWRMRNLSKKFKRRLHAFSA